MSSYGRHVADATTEQAWRVAPDAPVADDEHVGVSCGIMGLLSLPLWDLQAATNFLIASAFALPSAHARSMSQKADPVVDAVCDDGSCAAADAVNTKATQMILYGVMLESPTLLIGTHLSVPNKTSNEPTY